MKYHEFYLKTVQHTLNIIYTGEKLFFIKDTFHFLPDLKVVISNSVKDDMSLYKMLSEYAEHKINVPHRNAPGEELLDWHRENIFIK